MSTFPDRLTPVTVISGAAPEELSLKGMDRFSIDSCMRGYTYMYNDISRLATLVTTPTWWLDLTTCVHTHTGSIHFRGWKIPDYLIDNENKYPTKIMHLSVHVYKIND